MREGTAQGVALLTAVPNSHAPSSWHPQLPLMCMQPQAACPAFPCSCEATQMWSAHIEKVEVQLVPARAQPDLARLLGAVLADAACAPIHAAAAMSVRGSGCAARQPQPDSGARALPIMRVLPSSARFTMVDDELVVDEETGPIGGSQKELVLIVARDLDVASQLQCSASRAHVAQHEAA